MDMLHQEPERRAIVRRSHERCLALGLPDSDRPDYDPAPRADLGQALERDELLLRHARPVMSRLHRQVQETRGMVILTDAFGLVLHTLDEGGFIERAQRIALSQGVRWSESSKGTNAIGTAIVERRPTVIHGSEHFVRAHHFLTCAAAPILDATGSLLGVLDVTGDQRGYREHTIALVRMSATAIENTLIGARLQDGLTLRLHPRPEMIGTVAEGILAFDAAGRVVAANAAARELLGADTRRLAQESVASLFGIAFGALADRILRTEGHPLLLHLRDEQAVFASGEVRAVDGRLQMPGGWDRAPAQAAPARPPVAEAPPACPRPALPATSALARLDTGDARLSQVISQVRRVLDRAIPILVLGETGTGKELLARAIHADSRRAQAPFVAVNCAAIPETLIESELFGYEEGAFTGARRKGAVGRIQQAHKGTLFLDEIGDMPAPLQARLLRVLQERAVSPLGGTRSVPVDVDIVCATHRNLRELIDAGSFREDLYYRVNGLAVRLPPLRDRQDLPGIVAGLLATELQGCGPTAVAPDAMALLARHCWPGNIRQLSNVLRTACALAGDAPRITAEHLPESFLEELESGRRPRAEPACAREASTDLAGHELALIRSALAECQGNVSLAARRLGISRNTIYRKLRENE